MMKHSEKLEETVLWKTYQRKISSTSNRRYWVEKVYREAASYMLDVRRNFPNYTLHDKTHILNVLDAIGGLLRDQAEQLTVGESELLILAACLHDLGMVYTDEEKKQCFEDEKTYKEFLREYCPELLGCVPENWPEETKQWYLRIRHPFRIPEVLQNKAWEELFAERPLDAIPESCILAVCQAHGESPEELLMKADLRYLYADDTDPLFCAILLRLGDLLDFDDTRAPKVLYDNAVCNNEGSQAEWDKHMASVGFRYPASPSVDDLPFKAECFNPGVEHAVREFLDWIDEELGKCIRLQKYCNTDWQRNFPFPRAVLRKEIISHGYMSGDFCLTMDQTQILKLLTGENLYDNADVFVRELLQNAIDATLLRGEMDSDFVPEDSRIDLWEWSDENGDIWFRIDDQGTGMTLGMLQRYFLKVGNSYYTSKELKRDLWDHKQTDNYHGISRFGIGFLSSFLCGDYAEVSTLYFYPEKNRREESSFEASQRLKYGLRLQITGLSGYYVLKNQARQHLLKEPLPAPAPYDAKEQGSLEQAGYRAKPGTSIVIRLNPGKLGALNLRETVRKYLCGARIPVYYNNKRIGQTKKELLCMAHEMAGERIYELSSKMKKQFNRCFPAARGQYPKIVITTVPLDTEEDTILPELSGVLVKFEVRFAKTPQWKVKDLTYEVCGRINVNGVCPHMELYCKNSHYTERYIQPWSWLWNEFNGDDLYALEMEFEKRRTCPQTAEELGDIWLPFAKYMDLHTAWQSYHNERQEGYVEFDIAECGCPNIDSLFFAYQNDGFICAYQGIAAGCPSGSYSRNYYRVFLLEGEYRPTVKISRSQINDLPLKVWVAISGILNKNQMMYDRDDLFTYYWEWDKKLLKEWREVRSLQLDEWLEKYQKSFFTEQKMALEKPLKKEYAGKSISDHDDFGILYRYLMAYLQDNYYMTIDYERGQAISFYGKEEEEAENTFDLFPPMMFCKAANDRSRRYICTANSHSRRGITLDHPFVIWLLNNAYRMNQYFQRQFQQIVECLCRYDALSIIQKCNDIREQLLALKEWHGVDVRAFPELSMNDFWERKTL